MPAGGATQWLPIMVGDRRAREILFLCEEIPAEQALEWGLVNRVVPAAQLDAAVDELVEKLAAQAPADRSLHEAAAQLLARPAWHGTVGHARDWLALSMAARTEGGRAKFLERRRDLVGARHGVGGRAAAGRRAAFARFVRGGPKAVPYGVGRE